MQTGTGGMFFHVNLWHFFAYNQLNLQENVFVALCQLKTPCPNQFNATDIYTVTFQWNSAERLGKRTQEIKKTSSHFGVSRALQTLGYTSL